jgi:hypothetical protein
MIRTPRFKPTRDRKIDVRAEECPTCKAEPRQPCLKGGTIPSETSNHPSRRAMAVRRLNGARA